MVVPTIELKARIRTLAKILWMVLMFLYEGYRDGITGEEIQAFLEEVKRRGFGDFLEGDCLFKDIASECPKYNVRKRLSECEPDFCLFPNNKDIQRLIGETRIED